MFDPLRVASNRSGIPVPSQDAVGFFSPDQRRIFSPDRRKFCAVVEIFAAPPALGKK